MIAFNQLPKHKWPDVKVIVRNGLCMRMWQLCKAGCVCFLRNACLYLAGHTNTIADFCGVWGCFHSTVITSRSPQAEIPWKPIFPCAMLPLLISWVPPFGRIIFIWVSAQIASGMNIKYLLIYVILISDVSLQ